MSELSAPRQDAHKRGTTAFSWSAYSIMLTPLIGFYGSEFLFYLYRPAVNWLQLLSIVGQLMLFFLSIYVLTRWRLGWLLKISLTWVVLYLAELGVEMPYRWFLGQGFHIHTLLRSDYLSSCQLRTFNDKQADQAIGLCYRYDALQVCYYIIYDTEDQLALPGWQRSQVWKEAVSSLTKDTSSLIFPQDDGARLFGHYYQVLTLSGPGC